MTSKFHDRCSCKYDEADASSLLVQSETNPNFIIPAMLKLTTESTNKIQAYVFFPLDDRIYKMVKHSSTEYEQLAKATLQAFENAAIPQTNLFGIFSRGPVELDCIMLGTKQGVFFGVEKRELVHKRLRKFCKSYKPFCDFLCKYMPGSKSYKLVNEEFAVLYLPNFEHDQTHLRRARYIGVFGGNAYFLELDSGNICRIESRNECRIMSQFSHSFAESSCITHYKLNKSETMTPSELLVIYLSILYTKTVKILRHEPWDDTRWTPIVEKTEVEEERRIFINGQ